RLGELLVAADVHQVVQPQRVAHRLDDHRAGDVPQRGAALTDEIESAQVQRQLGPHGFSSPRGRRPPPTRSDAVLLLIGAPTGQELTILPNMPGGGRKGRASSLPPGPATATMTRFVGTAGTGVWTV